MTNSINSKKSTSKTRAVMLFSIGLAMPLILPTGAKATDSNAWQPAEMPRFNIAGLARPMSPTTLQLLFNEAESAYRSKRTAQAAETLQGLIELEPAATAAWFRLGNIWQSQGQTQWAIFAYKQAAQIEAIALPAQPADVRQKALLNLASLHLQGSRAALDLIQSEDSQSTHLTAAANRVADQIEAQTSEANIAKQALLDRAERVATTAQAKASVVKPPKQAWVAAKSASSAQSAMQSTIPQTGGSDQRVQLFSGQTR